MTPSSIHGRIERIETITIGRSIREYDYLVALYGPGGWRKLKGFALVALPDGTMERADIHWYDPHGFGRKKSKLNAYWK